MRLMNEHFRVQAEPRIERLAIVESNALENRIQLLASSDQRLFAQVADESLQEFSRRFVDRIGTLPPARVGLLMLSDSGEFEPRWRNLLALASRIQSADSAELVISVRAGSPSESVGWRLLESASYEPFFRGIHLRLQFDAPRAAANSNQLASHVPQRAVMAANAMSA